MKQSVTNKLEKYLSNLDKLLIFKKMYNKLLKRLKCNLIAPNKLY